MPLQLSSPLSGEDLAAQTIAAGVPTSFDDNFAASWDSARLNDRFVGEQAALSDEYAAANDNIFKATGQRLPNPYESELPPGVSPMSITGDPRIPVPLGTAVQQYEEYAQKLGITVPTFAEISAAAHAKMHDLAVAQADTDARASGTLGHVGSFLGQAAAVGTDPPILLSMMAGGPAADSLLGVMGREALTAGTTQAFLEPQIQSQHIAAGLPGGFAQGAEDVAMTAGGAALFGGLLHTGATAYRALRGLASSALDRGLGSAAEADAARYTERYADLQGANPLADTPEAAAEHVDRVSQAQTRLYDPSAAVPETRIPDEPSNPVRPDAITAPKTPSLDSADAATMRNLETWSQKVAREAHANAASTAEFQAMQTTARQLHDSGLTDDTLNLVRGPAPTAPRDDPSLVQFIVGQGGVSDADRSLAQAGVSPKDRPGLIRASAKSASEMSELASEAGYFAPAADGEGGRAVDQRELAQAIRDELSGQKLYARYGGGGNPEARATYEATVRQHRDVSQALDRLGIDPRAASNDEIRDAVQAIAERRGTGSEVAHDFGAEDIEKAVAAARELDTHAADEERIAMAAENTAREDYADRMDDLVYVEMDNGEVRAITARDLFKGLDEDQRLVREYSNCIGVPF